MANQSSYMSDSQTITAEFLRLLVGVMRETSIVKDYKIKTEPGHYSDGGWLFETGVGMRTLSYEVCEPLRITLPVMSEDEVLEQIMCICAARIAEIRK